jgi:hypothetical protein
VTGSGCLFLGSLGALEVLIFSYWIGLKLYQVSYGDSLPPPIKYRRSSTRIVERTWIGKMALTRDGDCNYG